MKEKLEDQWWKGTVFEKNDLVTQDGTLREDVFWSYLCYKCLAKEKGIELAAAIRIVRGERSEKSMARSRTWVEQMTFIQSVYLFLSEVIDVEEADKHNLKGLTECAHCRGGVPSVHNCYLCGKD